MKKILVLILMLSVFACAKKYTRAPEVIVGPEEEIKEEVVKTEEAAPAEEETGIAYAQEEKLVEEELSAEERAKAVFKDVLFDFDKYDIKPEARPILDVVAAFLNQEKNLNIVIEGHCDERGTNEYNLALGEKRAKSAKQYLVSLGVAPSRMITITYGEEKPVCNESNETCWQQNRRAHFVVVK